MMTSLFFQGKSKKIEIYYFYNSTIKNKGTQKGYSD